MTEPWQHPSVLYWSFTLLFTETDQTRKYTEKNELLIIICEAEGKQKSLDAVFNLPSVFSNKESVFVFPPFFSSAFSSAFSSRIILMALVRPSCHAINRFHKYPPPHVVYNCFRFLVKILVNTRDKSADLQKMRRGKNRGRESKADRWTTNVEESSPSEKYSKVWSSIPSMLHFFFHHSNSFSFCSWTQSICADIQCSNNLIFYPFFLNLGWIFHISTWLLCT